MRAGANRAISPYVIGGKRLAHLILSPTVVGFFETVLKKGKESLALEEIAVGPQSPIAGRSLGELRVKETSGASVLVVFRGAQPIANSGAELVLAPGDRLENLVAVPA
ncbi:MAG TPA: TrkA C-terminal domain-containing protein [Meiothermus sp.]|nr:TrkA C-terminal domain-containing protein [Meiothermus sp.]